MKIYAIYDRVAQESGPLFEAKNDLVAIRMTKEFFDKSPEDYDLYCLADYYHEECKIVGSPKRIVKGTLTGYVEDENE